MRTIRAASLSFIVATQFPTQLAGPAAALIAGLASALALASSASAQPAPAKATDPYQAVVSRDGVELRAGAGVFYYPVANLKAGTRLRVVGEDNGFLKVAYPDGLKAFIRAGDDVTVDPSGKTLKLVKQPRVLHANLTSGAKGSFCPIAFEKEPEVGAQFTILETIKGDDGKPSHFAIPAPAGTFGFVNKESLRKLTPEELTPAAKPAASPAAPASTPGGPTTPAAPASATPPAASPGSSPAATPSTPPATPPATPPVSTPPSTTPAVDGQPTPTAATPSEPAAPVAPAPTPEVLKADTRKADMDSLVAIFKRVQSQGQQEAELAPAIQAFKAFISRLSDSPSDRRLADHLGKYVEVMQLRLDLRETLNKPEAGIPSLESRHVEIDRQLAELEKLAVYKAIGRLLSSTVYDGTRLPKLYRVVSPEPGNGRTLGYVQPRDGLDLEGKLGRIVGVIGESKLDESLKANLVAPRRVDVLSLAPLSGSSPSMPAPIAPTPQPR